MSDSLNNRWRMTEEQKALADKNYNLVHSVFHKVKHLFHETEHDDLREVLDAAYLRGIVIYDQNRGRLSTLVYRCMFREVKILQQRLARRRENEDCRVGVPLTHIPDRVDPPTIDAETRQEIDKLLATVPMAERPRQVLMMLLSPENLTMREVARRLAVTTETVRTAFKRAVVSIQSSVHILDKLGDLLASHKSCCMISMVEADSSMRKREKYSRFCHQGRLKDVSVIHNRDEGPKRLQKSPYKVG